MSTKKVKLTLETDYLIEVPDDYEDLKALADDLPSIMCVEFNEDWAGKPPVDMRQHEHTDVRVAHISFEQ